MQVMIAITEDDVKKGSSEIIFENPQRNLFSFFLEYIKLRQSIKLFNVEVWEMIAGKELLVLRI